MLNRRRIATIATTLAALALPGVAGASTPFPSTDPAQTFAGNEAGIKSDTTVPLYLNGNSLTTTGSGNTAKPYLDDGLGGQWIITRTPIGTAGVRDHRSVINAGPVYVYNKRAKAYMVRTNGPQNIAFSKTPNAQWRLDKQAGDRNLRLFNTQQNDVLVFSFPKGNLARVGWLKDQLPMVTRDTQYVTMTRTILPTDGSYHSGTTAARSGVITGIGNVNPFTVRVLRRGQKGDACLDPNAPSVTLPAYDATTKDELDQLGLLNRRADATQVVMCAGFSAPGQFSVWVSTQNAMI